MTQIEELYNQSSDFKEYVDKYCRDYGYTVNEALGHAIVREVEGYYRKNGLKESQRIPVEKSTYLPMGECV